MLLDFNLINVIILLGAIQGVILCFILYKRKSLNPLATKYFVLFLFSLSFLNLFFALLDNKFLDIYAPLYVFPFPYKYLLGPAFYFYVKNNFKLEIPNKFITYEILFFLPAILYGIINMYWFFLSMYENSYRIIGKLVILGFFRVNEFVFLLFTILLLVNTLKLISKSKKDSKYKPQEFNFIRQLTHLFLGLVLFNLVISFIDLIVHNGDDTMLFNYPHLIINSIFIYWIGYIGFIKPSKIIRRIPPKESEKLTSVIKDIEHHLYKIMEVDEAFKEKTLTLTALALKLNIPAKDLSVFINKTYNMNFSEYLNHYRIEKVKCLLASPNSKKYTLIALAEEAGFKSKSAFYSTFKKHVNLTPNKYRDQLNKGL